MSFGIRFADDASKELEKLDNSIKIQIMNKIDDLRANPNLGKGLAHALKHQKKLYVGNYRVLYSFIENTVVIIKISHRKIAYTWRK
jgi:mRNA-degrading endonuclease RelE of RelBE toxin-antitoxin system